jgi:hypothetical protein
MNIRHIFDFNLALFNGPYAWPGGYPRFFITADGGSLSFKAAEENAGLIRDAIIAHDKHGGWCVIGVEINWEDNFLICDHSNEIIPCAYPSDDDSDSSSDSSSDETQ